jgi:ketosteroid isomerase-like protein
LGTEEQNVAILKKAYNDWQETKGDGRVWHDILDDNIDFGSLADGKPGMEFTRPRASKTEVLDYFEGLAADWTMEYYIVNEYVAQGNRVVALGECSWTNKRNGKTISTPKVDVWLFENNKAVQFMEHYDTYATIMASQD